MKEFMMNINQKPSKLCTARESIDIFAIGEDMIKPTNCKNNM